MISLATLALFGGACLALTITPGPDMLLIASRSISQGRAAGFASLVGAQVGIYCYALAVALGLAKLLETAPIAYDVVRFAGAAYLFYLAWKTLRSAATRLAPNESLPRFSNAAIFRQGLLTNMLNPKVALFMLALFPQFVSPDAGSIIAQMLVLATVLNVIALLVNGTVILTASQLSKRMAAKPSRLPNYLLGSVFAGLAFRLALASR